MLALAGVLVAGLATGVFVTSGAASPQVSNATVRVTVVAREFSFTLSKRSVPTGTTVIFTVVNKGKISHNFKIAGKKTKTLNPGQSATLTVKFAKKGQYPYLCTVSATHPRV
jgi:plastocyanin